jgi:hypothetical protein
MNARKRSTVYDSAASAPTRETLKLPSHNEAEQAKADLTTWEGEGGAVAHPATSAPSPGAPADDAAADAERVDVIDTIASIEMHRQLMDKEVGREVARTEALRKLHDALAAEKASAGGDAGNSSNIAAVTRAIEKLQAGPHGRRDRNDRKAAVLKVPAARQNTTRSPARPRVRRTMGRHGNR